MKESLGNYSRVMLGHYARHTGKKHATSCSTSIASARAWGAKMPKVLRKQRRRGTCSNYGIEDITVRKAVWLAANLDLNPGAMLAAMLAAMLRMLRDYRDLLVAEIRQTVESNNEVDAEMAHLMKVVAESP